MKSHENSTFYEEKKRFKEVKKKLEEQTDSDTPLIFKKIKVISPTIYDINRNDFNRNNNMNDFNEQVRSPFNSSFNNIAGLTGDCYEITNKLIDFISETLKKLFDSSCINNCEIIKNYESLKDYSCIKSRMVQIQQKTEDLIRLVNRNTELLKETNDVVYSVFYKMNRVCRQSILNNPTIFGIVEEILLKFCEVKDFLDFDQEEETIEALFEMSKMIYIYKSRISDIIKEDYVLKEDYKKDKFGFFYSETNELNKRMSNLSQMEEEEPYTDWSTWVESFIEEKEVNNIEEEQKNRNGREEETFLSPKQNNIDESCIEFDSFNKHTQLVSPPTYFNNLHNNLSNNLHNNLHNTLHNNLPNILPTSHTTFTIKEMSKIVGVKAIPFTRFKPRSCVNKIGEATFSEVFRDASAVHKIIPLGDSEDKTPYDVFIGECFIQHTLSNEKGICRLKQVRLVRGKYTEIFLKAWDKYGKVENDRPSKYKDSQVFGIISMFEGNIPLEKVCFVEFNLFKFIKLLVQILSELEDKYEFEHRDLHWGNILVGPRSIKIIDFTLSRLKKDGKVVYNNLSRYKWLFEGDASVDEQFEVYRKMRNACNGNWSSYNPHSNLYWVGYLGRKCQKEIEKIRTLTKDEKNILKLIETVKTVKDLNLILNDQNESLTSKVTPNLFKH